MKNEKGSTYHTNHKYLNKNTCRYAKYVEIKKMRNEK